MCSDLVVIRICIGPISPAATENPGTHYWFFCFLGRPPLCGLRTRPTSPSKRSKNASSPRGRPVYTQRVQFLFSPGALEQDLPIPNHRQQRHQLDASGVIPLVEERLPTTIPPLRQMMRHTRDDHSCQSCHPRKLPNLSHFVNNWYCVPRFLALFDFKHREPFPEDKTYRTQLHRPTLSPMLSKSNMDGSSRHSPISTAPSC